MRPRIGMPLCLDIASRWRPGHRYHYIHEAYPRALAEAGGTPLYLPLQAKISDALDTLDGLLIPGGDDLPPEEPIPGATLSLVPPEQLAFDRALLHGARARRLPEFGICYGMQLMALEAGGTLIHHLPSGRPGGEAHQLPEREGRHGLLVSAGSHLARIIGEQPEPVNSLHQQGVADAGPELAVAGRAPDGLIEAIEGPQGFYLGVQWHPERLPGPQSSRLFSAFVEACRRG